MWPVGALFAQIPSLDENQLNWLGDRIYANECGRKEQCLTSWNAGEEFPSLGIGHFIWYPQGYSGPFVETFPDLLAYLHEQGVVLPAWLLHADGAPWPDREAFITAHSSAEMEELRQLLLHTRALQTRFIVGRFHAQLQELATTHSHFDAGMLELVNTLGSVDPPHGLFALIDYVHFKGWGVAVSERYQGQGWGLLQVLSAMDRNRPGLQQYVVAAEQVLRQRVALAPPQRNEQRWLQGWLNRVNGYLPGQ